jgi:CHAP domain
MNTLQFQLDYLDNLVKTLQHHAETQENLYREVQDRMGAAQSVGANDSVTGQLRSAASLLAEHPSLVRGLSRDLKARLDIAHSVADDWQGPLPELRIGLKIAMTATTGLLAAVGTAVGLNQKGKSADAAAAKKAADAAAGAKQGVAAVATAAAARGLGKSLFALAPAEPAAGWVKGPPVTVAKFGSTDIYYNPPYQVDANGHPALDAQGHWVPVIQDGYHGQCVELVQRLYADHGWLKTPWRGSADLGEGDGGLWKAAQGRPDLQVFSNNPPATTAPRTGDALLFGGHVAVVVAVNGDAVTFAQQNVTYNHQYLVTDTIHLDTSKPGVFQLSPQGVSGYNYGGTILGWVHPTADTGGLSDTVQLSGQK